jgi:RNA polymerase sigma-70 factor (ECF subfamily)
MQSSRHKQFDTLVSPHLETLYRMAYRLVRNAADAQDLVQDTCVAACSSLDTLAAADSALAWLLRVQHNRFIDACRRRGRSPLMGSEESDDVAQIVSELPDPEQMLQQLQSEQQLERAFLQLDGMQRALLSLCAEGYSLPEMQGVLGVEGNALSARLYRARLRLARLIADMNRDAGSVRQIGSRK